MLGGSSQKASPCCALKLLVDKLVGRNSFLRKRDQRGLSRAVDHAAGYAAEPKGPKSNVKLPIPVLR